MSYSNRTPNLGLPQWLASDKPNWDIDTNEAFEKIDDFAGNVNSETASLGGRITNNQDAIESLQSEVQTQSGIITTHGTRISDLETQNQTQQTSINKLNTDVSALQDGMTLVKETNIPAIEQDVSTLQSQTSLNTQNITQNKSDISAIRNTKRYYFLRGGGNNQNFPMKPTDFNLSLEEIALLKQSKIVGVELSASTASNEYTMERNSGTNQTNNIFYVDYSDIKEVFDTFLDDYSERYQSESDITAHQASKPLYAVIYQKSFSSTGVTTTSLGYATIQCRTAAFADGKEYVRGLQMFITGASPTGTFRCNLILEKEGD